MQRLVLFWICVGALLVATLLLIVRAWMRSSREHEGASDSSAIDFLREKRATLEADLRCGLLTEATFQSSLEELEREAIDAASSAPQGTDRPLRSRFGFPAALCAVVVAASCGLYGLLGSPVLMRLDAGSGSGLLRSDGSLRENTAQVSESDLERYLAEKPSDERAWVILAQSRVERRAFESAFAAYRKALDLKGMVVKDPDVLTEAAAVSMSRRTPEGYRDAVGLLRETIEIAGESPRVCELGAIAALESEDWDFAVANLSFVLESLSADDPGYERMYRALRYARERQKSRSTSGTPRKGP